jgi:Major Facilitator Superfamily
MAHGTPAARSIPRMRRRVALLFYSYRILSRAYFHLPILWVWFVADHGVSVQAAAVLLAVYSATLTFGAPLAQRLQRVLRQPAYSLVAGEIVKAGGLLALIFAGGSLAAAAAAQLVGGIGYSLGQGPDSVLLRSLYRDDEAAEYSSLESRSMSLVFLSVLIAGVIGGFLYSVVPAWPFLAAIGTAILAAGVAAWMAHAIAAPTASPAAAASSPAEPATSRAQEGGTGLRRLRPGVATAAQWRWMAYYATVRGLAVAAFVALLPMVFFQDLRVHVSMFGVILGSFSVFAYGSGRYGMRVLRHVPDALVPLLSLIALAGSFALFAVAHVLVVALAGMAVLGAANGVVRPLAMSRLQSVPARSAAERGRVIAAMERLYGTVNAAIVIAGGLLAGAYGARGALWGLCALAVILGAAGFVAFAPAQSARPRPVAGPSGLSSAARETGTGRG